MGEIINKVILIGNGFDLAHGLKTRYSDFIHDFWNKETEKILSSTKKSVGSYLSKYEDDIVNLTVNEGIWNTLRNRNTNLQGYQLFKEILQYINNTQVSGTKVDYNNNFIIDLSEKIISANWADIEYEYYLALIDCINNKRHGGVVKLNTEFEIIKNDFVNYLNSLTYNADIRKSVISNNIENIICPGRRDKKIEMSPDDSILFINFNYTATLDNYLDKYTDIYENEIIHLHIHGELLYKNNPIIFGYGDDIDDKYKLIENKNDNKYLVNVKSIKYSDTPNYNKMLSFINPDKYEIYIMGLSCGISDRTLLHTLFEHDNCVSIKIFYHKDGNTDNFSDVVGNISRNFNDKSLMRARLINKRDSTTLS